MSHKYPHILGVRQLMREGNLLPAGVHIIHVTQNDYAKYGEVITRAPGYMHVMPMYVPSVPHHLVVLQVEVYHSSIKKDTSLTGEEYNSQPIMVAIHRGEIDNVYWVYQKDSAHTVQTIRELLQGGTPRNITIVVDSFELQQELWQLLKFRRWDFIIVVDNPTKEPA